MKVGTVHGADMIKAVKTAKIEKKLLTREKLYNIIGQCDKEC